MLIAIVATEWLTMVGSARARGDVDRVRAGERAPEASDQSSKVLRSGNACG